MDKNFEIDVAFTLLHLDESEANNIVTDLGMDIKSFLYTRKQEELVGNDVVLKFKDVFGYKSRLVVVMYREGWGTTNYTYVEEEAIRDRKFREKSEKFIIFVNITGKDKMPEWISDRTIWYDYKAFGRQGIVALIKHKVYERGGLKRPETALESVKRKKSEQQFEIKRTNFINSKEGVKKATSEFMILKVLIQEKFKEINKLYPDYTCEDRGNSLAISSNMLTYHIVWNAPLLETLEAIEPYDKAQIKLTVMQRETNDRFLFDSNKYNKIVDESYYFNMFYPEFCGWEQKGKHEYIPTNNLVEETIKILVPFL